MVEVQAYLGVDNRTHFTIGSVDRSSYVHYLGPENNQGVHEDLSIAKCVGLEFARVVRDFQVQHPDQML